MCNCRRFRCLEASKCATVVDFAESGGVRKGVFVTVWSVNEKGLVLLDGRRLSGAAVLRSLRLAHSLTIAGCQGLSLAGRVKVIPHSSMTTRELYVACSRATAAGLLEVA